MSEGKEVPGTEGRWREYSSEGRTYYYDKVSKRTTWRDPRLPNPRALVNSVSRAWSTAPAGDNGSLLTSTVAPLPLHKLKYAEERKEVVREQGSSVSTKGVREAGLKRESRGSSQKGVAGLNRLKVLQSISNDIEADPGSWRERQTAALINAVAAKHGLPPPPKDRYHMFSVNGEFCELLVRKEPLNSYLQELTMLTPDEHVQSCSCDAFDWCVLLTVLATFWLLIALAVAFSNGPSTGADRCE